MRRFSFIYTIYAKPVCWLDRDPGLRKLQQLQCRSISLRLSTASYVAASTPQQLQWLQRKNFILLLLRLQILAQSKIKRFIQLFAILGKFNRFWGFDNEKQYKIVRFGRTIVLYILGFNTSTINIYIKHYIPKKRIWRHWQNRKTKSGNIFFRCHLAKSKAELIVN